MKTVRVDRYRVTKRVLAEAVAVLRDGGVVVHPSESSYGLAVDPANRAAVRRLYNMKGRSGGKGLIVVAASFDQARRYVRLSGELLKLARKSWPGPLTVVAPAAAELFVAGGRPADELALRVPASAWPRALAAELGRPVTSTSANVSGDAPAYSSSAVRRAFAGRELKPDIILDAGRLPDRPASTLVRQSGQGIEILRQGPVKV